MLIAPGERQRAQLRVQNYSAPMQAEMALVAPGEWRIEPRRADVPARGKQAREFEMRFPRDWTPPSPRFAIAADVRANGKYLGQITEAVVEMKSLPGTVQT
jgi:hypothetical protein